MTCSCVTVSGGGDERCGQEARARRMEGAGREAKTTKKSRSVAGSPPTAENVPGTKSWYKAG